MVNKIRVILLMMVVTVVGMLSGCVSLEEYDAWQLDAYEAEGKELERFEQLSSEYEHSIFFESVSDEAIMRGVTGMGQVEDGLYRFDHDGESEYAHFHIDLEELQNRIGDRLTRLAFLSKAWNHESGFVEVYPGGDIGDDGGNPTSSKGQSGLANGRWKA